MIHPPELVDARDLPLWHAAMSQLKCGKNDFQHPPKWLDYVARHLPLDDVRVRRDWDRFLTFCCAIALCRSFRNKDGVDIEFEDYCVAYLILEPVFASTLDSLPAQEVLLAKAVRKMNCRRKRGVTVHELAEKLHWKESLVYKHIKKAIKAGLIKYETGTREKNVKCLAPRHHAAGFLPHPRLVLKRNREIGRKVKYVDPFTGQWKKLER